MVHTADRSTDASLNNPAAPASVQRREELRPEIAAEVAVCLEESAFLQKRSRFSLLKWFRRNSGGDKAQQQQQQLTVSDTAQWYNKTQQQKVSDTAQDCNKIQKTDSDAAQECNKIQKTDSDAAQDCNKIQNTVSDTVLEHDKTQQQKVSDAAQGYNESKQTTVSDPAQDYNEIQKTVGDTAHEHNKTQQQKVIDAAQDNNEIKRKTVSDTAQDYNKILETISDTAQGYNKLLYFREQSGNLNTSTASVDTLLSTTTVHSFAYHRGASSISSGSLNSKNEEIFIDALRRSNVEDPQLIPKPSSTLPRVSSRRQREAARNAYSTARNTSEPHIQKHRKLHVKGKRRAPEPPEKSWNPPNSTLNTRRKRPAPEPPKRAAPEDEPGMEEPNSQVIFNDTLMLQGGLLLSSRAKNQSTPGNPEPGTVPTSTDTPPRPWYKRNVFDRDSGSLLRREPRKKDNLPEESSSSRVHFFGREDKRKESKRKSTLSVLTNISELDREAAAIVHRRKHERPVGELLNEQEFPGISESLEDIEASPRRGTRALISRFNAIGNIGRGTRNGTLFGKGGFARRPLSKFDVARNNDGRETRVFGVEGNRKDVVEARLREGTRIVDEKLDAPGTARAEQAEVRSLEGAKLGESTDGELGETGRAGIDERVERRNATRITLVKSTDGKLERIETSEAGRAGNDERVERRNATRITVVKSADGKLERIETSEAGRAGNDERVERCNATRITVVKNADGKLERIEPSEAERAGIDERVERCNATRITVVKSADGKLERIETSEAGRAEIDERVERRNATRKLETSEAGRAEIDEGKIESRRKGEDPTRNDLKEILKEMKHSLPKRPKSKKAQAEKVQDCQAGKKVSSGVQTSGNVRKVQIGEAASGSGWRLEDVVYTTTGRNVGRSGLLRNSFQLMRPRDFACIEATKTNRDHYKENAYANVPQDPLYANTREIPARLSGDINNFGDANNTRGANGGRMEARKIPLAERVEPEDFSAKNNMNTVAVNRLLRKLEAAIGSGQHQQAAGLAKELARLKIHCSVIRQRTTAQVHACGVVNVNMYIEDKLAHQGPIPLELPMNMTVAGLKAKVYEEFEIPTNVQRWIIGKSLAERDDSTLESLQAMDGSTVFLYLVAPVVQNDDSAQTEEPIAVVHEQELEVTVPQVEEAAEASQEHTEEGTKQKRYQQLVSLEDCDVIPNSEPMECPVCFAQYDISEGVILRDCLHMFCRTCIANTIQYCEEAEVKCPFRNPEYTCESTLQEREIKALVSPEIYEQHLAKSITQAENNAGNEAYHCKTPDCPGWCIYDDNVNDFLCPVCGANNCLTCQAIHAGKNCREYQEELRLSKETDQESKRTAAMLEGMVESGEALACPTCAVVLMKKWGCDWLRCSMCKTEICWVTRGPRWGPGGKGDTSGGCKCGENGVKCHPRCNYCH